MLTRLHGELAPVKRPVRPQAGNVQLREIDIEEIPEINPVHRLGRIYETLVEDGDKQHLPSIEALFKVVPEELTTYALILAPFRASPFIDFEVLHKGHRIPGVDLAEVLPGELYSDRIAPAFAAERLMELASCLALKECRFTCALSARPSTLNVKVFRAVMPVWLEERQQLGVVLAIAPVYVATSAKSEQA